MSTEYLDWVWTGSKEPFELSGSMTIGAGKEIVADLRFPELQCALAFSNHIDSLIAASYASGVAAGKRTQKVGLKKTSVEFE